MANLSARGRTVLVAAVREYDEVTLQAAHARRYPDLATTASLTSWERLTRCLMSDSVILEKREVRFRPDWLDKDGRRYSYGWRVHGRLKAGLTPTDFARIYASPRKDGRPSPWTVTTEGVTDRTDTRHLTGTGATGN